MMAPMSFSSVHGPPMIQRQRQRRVSAPPKVGLLGSPYAWEFIWHSEIIKASLHGLDKLFCRARSVLPDSRGPKANVPGRSLAKDPIKYVRVSVVPLDYLRDPDPDAASLGISFPSDADRRALSQEFQATKGIVMTLLRYMNLSEHLVSTFNFAILHSLDTHFVYLLAIKSMPIMINPNPTQPNPNPNPKPTAVSHSLLIFFKTTVLHTPTSNPSSPCPFFLSI
ncbi:hypothetical protein B0H13DRAFT_2530871 [Mycena leptocephala]|nr:hypothetical protein B0H13DRAFT_2530871 [Mycena leptocephala]